MPIKIRGGDAAAGEEEDDNNNHDLIGIIIGAGPSGLATALALSNQKICSKIYVIEKHKSFDKRGSTFGLAPNGQKMLSKLHPYLVDKMKDVGIDTSGGRGGGGGEYRWVISICMVGNERCVIRMCLRTTEY